MSELKISTGLFLGKQELVREQKFLQDKINYLIAMNTHSYGLITDYLGNVGSNFEVLAGTNVKTIKFAYDSKAIDSDINIITQLAQDNISVTPISDGYYWVKVAYVKSSVEAGTCSIDANGNVTGVGTKFTEVLRSNGFRSKIKFSKLSGSPTNSGEYEVVDVIDDTNIILSGTTFTSEVILLYSVVGTFTPGQVTPSSDKYPFQHDSCNITYSAETTVNTPPTRVLNKEFYLARIRIVSGAITSIEDKRTEFYVSK